MKTPLFVPMAVLLLGQVLYHSVARGLSRGASPFLMVTVAYVVGLILTGCAWVITGGQRPTDVVMSQVVRNGVLLGIAVSCVEVGYVFAYRRGLSITSGPLVALSLTTLMLIPIGVFLYNDPISVRIVAGGCVVVFGLWLMLG